MNRNFHAPRNLILRTISINTEISRRIFCTRKRTLNNTKKPKNNKKNFIDCPNCFWSLGVWFFGFFVSGGVVLLLLAFWCCVVLVVLFVSLFLWYSACLLCLVFGIQL